MKDKIFLFLLFFFSLVFYFLTLRGIYGNPKGSMIKNNLDQATKPFELSPERGRYILTMSLSENKSFALTKELADAAYPDVGYYKGKYYIYFAPGISILVLPLYYIGKNYELAQVGAFFTISLFAALTLIFLFKIAREIFKLPLWVAFLVPLIFGFASTSWSYSITLYQHLVTTYFVVSSFYAVWKYKNNSKFGWIWAIFIWFNYGYAIFIDYPNAIFMLPVMAYFFLSSFSISSEKEKIKLFFRPIILITSVIFLILIFIHGYYNYVNFGDWRRLSGSLVGLRDIEEKNLLKTSSGAATLKLIEQKKQPGGFFKEDRLPKGFSILTFGVDRGILLFSPIFMLAVFGIFALRKKINLEIAILLATVVINFFLYSSWADPWGGWAYGPRYLILSMAILAIFVGVWLNNSKHKIISRFATFILFVYSSFIALLGALTTNQVPPKIEADFLKMKYNFLLNWDYFIDGRSGSFVFNEFASKYMDLQQYFLLIYIPLILIVFGLLFIPLLFKRKIAIKS